MGRPANIDVLLLGAVPQEVSALIGLLRHGRVLTLGDQTVWCGKYANLSVLIGTTGLGKVNAAITTATILERLPVRQVWHIGCAGAYAEGPLRMGDVLITERFLCGDEGVLTRRGVLSVLQIGIPILVHEGEEYFDQVPLSWNGALRALIAKTPCGLYRQSGEIPLFPAHLRETADVDSLRSHGGSSGGVSSAELSPPLSQAEEAPDPACFRLLHGPSVTVGMTSGDLQVARERFQRYGAYAENMEGSAVAHACCRFRIPMVECRGISNFAGCREKETWAFEKSVAHVLGIIVNWLEALNAVKLLPRELQP